MEAGLEGEENIDLWEFIIGENSEALELKHRMLDFCLETPIGQLENGFKITNLFNPAGALAKHFILLEMVRSSEGREGTLTLENMGATEQSVSLDILHTWKFSTQDPTIFGDQYINPVIFDNIRVVVNSMAELFRGVSKNSLASDGNLFEAKATRAIRDEVSLLSLRGSDPDLNEISDDLLKRVLHIFEKKRVAGMIADRVINKWLENFKRKNPDKGLFNTFSSENVKAAKKLIRDIIVKMPTDQTNPLICDSEEQERVVGKLAALPIHLVTKELLEETLKPTPRCLHHFAWPFQV